VFISYFIVPGRIRRNPQYQFLQTEIQSLQKTAVDLLKELGDLNGISEDANRKKKRLVSRLEVLSEDVRLLAQRHADVPSEPPIPPPPAGDESREGLSQDLKDKFDAYLQTLASKNFFTGIDKSSNAYKERYKKAFAKFYERYTMPAAATTE